MSPSTSTLSIAVVVPSYRRPEDLRRCLAGLSSQTSPPNQVTVVARADDTDTLALISRLPTPPTLISVSEPGQVHAMRAGLCSTETDIVAFTDDDAVPRRDWVSRIVAHFSDPAVGGVGGRDVIPSAASQPWCKHVGVVGKWGRVVGNHHVGIGGARRVDVLKGVNMAFRRHLIQLPSGLRGGGAQAHNDLSVSLWVRRQGWDLIYDPDLIVDHYPAPRQEGTPRGRPPRQAVSDEAYNYTAALLAMRAVSPLRLLTYGLLFGNRAYPGLGRCLIGFASGEGFDLSRRLVPSLHGQLSAHHSYRAGERLGYDLSGNTACQQPLYNPSNSSNL